MTTVELWDQALPAVPLTFAADSLIIKFFGYSKLLLLMKYTIKNIGNTFGGINLEDIAAPECFIIEQKLKELLDIPVFHDDQHGTAIITTAALINALDISKKKIEKVKVVVNGAGA